MPTKHKLRAARDGAKLTQKQLKELSGVSTSTISHIECHRGPDVPKSERRPTKTKFSTALNLAAALSRLKPGEYTLAEFISAQSIFTELEIYEALANQREREARRRRRRGRHLRAVA